MTARKLPTKDMRDPTTIAVEVTEIKGDLALLASQVSTGLGNVTSQLSAVQGDLRDQGRVLKGVETNQHDMQAHSEGLDRLARAIERSSVDFANWRKDHEADNRSVADRVTAFRGAVIGFGILGGALMTISVLWVNAEFGNLRREASARQEALAEARGQIKAKHEQDITQLWAAVKELRNSEGLK